MNFVQPIRDRALIEKMKNILMHQSYRNYFLFVLGINSGLRISDMLPLKVGDVKGKEHIVLTEQKTGKYKRFPINTGLKKEIDAYTRGMDPEDYLFPSRIGKKTRPITRYMAYKILNNAAEELGLGEVGTHTLRKTFGYHFYQEYRDLAVLKEIFNHATTQVTMRYIGINQDVIDKAMRDFKL